jgi:serine protein kinase
MQGDARSIIQYIRDAQDTKRYREHHWNGSFEEYLELLLRDPKVARNAYQRIYDMVLSYGVEEYVENKEKVLRYKFFMDPGRRRP